MWGSTLLHPNLLLDPTQLIRMPPPLPDMLSSCGFPWRCLNAAVPTVTLSLSDEARRRKRPSWVFLNEWRRVQGNVAVPTLIHTFYLIYTQAADSLFTRAGVHNTYSGGGWLQLSAGHTVASEPGIHQPERGSPSAWKNSFRSYLGKNLFVEGKGREVRRRSDCSLASAAWFNLVGDSVSDHLYSPWFGRWESAEERETKGRDEEKLFVYRETNRQTELWEWNSICAPGIFYIRLSGLVIGRDDSITGKNKVGLTAYHMYWLTNHQSEKLYMGRGWQIAGMENTGVC